MGNCCSETKPAGIRLGSDSKIDTHHQPGITPGMDVDRVAAAAERRRVEKEKGGALARKLAQQSSIGPGRSGAENTGTNARNLTGADFQ